jgi:hypothetical protein
VGGVINLVTRRAPPDRQVMPYGELAGGSQRTLRAGGGVAGTIGAFDYLAKPYDEKALVERVAKALAHRQVKDGNEGLRERLGPHQIRLFEFQPGQVRHLDDRILRSPRVFTAAGALLAVQTVMRADDIAHREPPSRD